MGFNIFIYIYPILCYLLKEQTNILAWLQTSQSQAVKGVKQKLLDWLTRFTICHDFIQSRVSLHVRTCSIQMRKSLEFGVISTDLFYMKTL